jgi:hypothetical protein
MSSTSLVPSHSTDASDYIEPPFHDSPDLRHSSSATTLEHYIKSVPESVRVAVESLDHMLKKAPADSGQPAN